jgi:hypothetical protein
MEKTDWSGEKNQCCADTDNIRKLNRKWKEQWFVPFPTSRLLVTPFDRT